MVLANPTNIFRCLLTTGRRHPLRPSSDPVTVVNVCVYNVWRQQQLERSNCVARACWSFTVVKVCVCTMWRQQQLERSNCVARACWS